MTSRPHDRRGVSSRHFRGGALRSPVRRARPARASSATPQAAAGDYPFLPFYARAQSYKSLKQSSYDRTGGNGDRWPIAPGGVQEVFNATGPGVITHIWFTIAARSDDHLKELVLRGYWDGNCEAERRGARRRLLRPESRRLPDLRIRVPGVFAGPLAELLLRDAVQAVRRRLTVTNEGTQEVGAFYSNIDYLTVPKLPDDALYFHAQYRQSAPCTPVTRHGAQAQSRPASRTTSTWRRAAAGT